jgi:hypothetical protein
VPLSALLVLVYPWHAQGAGRTTLVAWPDITFGKLRHAVWKPLKTLPSKDQQHRRPSEFYPLLQDCAQGKVASQRNKCLLVSKVLQLTFVLLGGNVPLYAILQYLLVEQS